MSEFQGGITPPPSEKVPAQPMQDATDVKDLTTRVSQLKSETDANSN